MIKKHYGSVFVFDMKSRKTCMVPFLVPFRTGIMVPKVDQVFVHFLKELINSSCSRKTAKSLINCCGVYLCDKPIWHPVSILSFKLLFFSYDNLWQRRMHLCHLGFFIVVHIRAHGLTLQSRLLTSDVMSGPISVSSFKGM